MNFESGKNLIGEGKIVCPYCDKLTGKGKTILSAKHLTMHNKTIEDVRKEFPDLITLTLQAYNIFKEHGLKQLNEMKKAKCYYYNDDDCSKIEIDVPKTSPYFYMCKTCLGLGKENPDKRTKKEAYEKRAKNLEKKWGSGVTNPRHIPGVIEKATQTNIKRYGGVGPASPILAEKMKKTMNGIFGTDNVMQSDKGKKLFQTSLSNKYGEGIKSPTQIKLVAEKISEKLKGRTSPHKGKTYYEIYEPDKAEKLIEEKRQIGAKSYSINPTPSEFQNKLFDIVKNIFKNVRLEYLILGEDNSYGKYGYVLDIAIPDHNLCIEYDSSYYHNTEEMINHDKIRDEVLKSNGWITIRFRDKIPTEDELKIEIVKRLPNLFTYSG